MGRDVTAALPDLPPTPPGDKGERDEVLAGNIVLGPMDEKLGFHLWLAHSVFSHDLTPRLASVGLTPRQCAPLVLIGANPGTSQVTLAALLETDRTTMMGLIDRLEDSGFVERRRSRVDRRRQELHLTAQGRAVLSEAEEMMALNEMQVGHRALDADEWRTLVGLLRRLHQRS